MTKTDFSNREGLSALAQSGWYSGVPAGWTAAAPPEKQDGFFAVINFGATGFFANLHVLSRIKPQFEAFQQEIGVLAEASDITLNFDTTDFKDEAISMGAAIANARAEGLEVILAEANSEAGRGPSAWW